MIRDLRAWLRRRPLWVELQEVNREGWRQAHGRRRWQRLILRTPPIATPTSGPVEIRMLTWRRDWLNALWALKSFYCYSGAEYPLTIHDGGLEPRSMTILREHFPSAVVLEKTDADARVEGALRARGFSRSLAYRRRNVASLKLFDFFLLSSADQVISIDSDIVFFRQPRELLARPDEAAPNLYNKDLKYAYSMQPDELRRAFGIEPPPFINSGLSRVARRSIDFRRIEDWLDNRKLFDDRWVTEQTLHALCSALHGVELLPDTYRVSVDAGLPSDLVCKHYPGFFRPLLYQEGMRSLVNRGFLEPSTRGCPARGACRAPPAPDAWLRGRQPR